MNRRTLFTGAAALALTPLLPAATVESGWDVAIWNGQDWTKLTTQNIHWVSFPPMTEVTRHNLIMVGTA